MSSVTIDPTPPTRITIPARDLRVGYTVVRQEFLWTQGDAFFFGGRNIPVCLEASRVVEIVDRDDPARVGIAFEGLPAPVYFDPDEQVVVLACEDDF